MLPIWICQMNTWQWNYKVFSMLPYFCSMLQAQDSKASQPVLCPNLFIYNRQSAQVAMTLICVTITVMRDKSDWYHPFPPVSWHPNMALLIETCKLAFIDKVIYTFNRNKLTIRKYEHRSRSWQFTNTDASFLVKHKRFLGQFQRATYVS